MTYLVGFKHFGVNSIISDARITFEGPGRTLNDNNLLKTGEMFPGCIYGRAGDERASRDFVRAAKTMVRGSHTLAEKWHRFGELIGFYHFPKCKANGEGHFKLLLSTRSSGKPELFILDSYHRALFRCDEDWVSIGSGKPILDPLAEKINQLILQGAQNLHSSSMPPGIYARVYPYFACLWLTQLAVSSWKQRLEESGVGGVFHFIWQTSAGDGPQEPALYVFLDADTSANRIFHWVYRVCYAQRCLVVVKLTPPGQVREAPQGEGLVDILCSESSRPGISDIMTSEEATSEFVASMIEYVDSLPFYRFCGFGFLDAQPEQLELLAHVSNDGDYAYTRDGQMATLYRQHIEQHFEARSTAIRRSFASAPGKASV